MFEEIHCVRHILSSPTSSCWKKERKKNKKNSGRLYFTLNVAFVARSEHAAIMIHCKSLCNQISFFFLFSYSDKNDARAIIRINIWKFTKNNVLHDDFIFLKNANEKKIQAPNHAVTMKICALTSRNTTKVGRKRENGKW